MDIPTTTETKSRPKSNPKDRAVLSPEEFGDVFGKSKSWTYRMIYSGKIRTIHGLGYIMVPASEIARLTGEASAEYVPQTKRGRKPANA
jgi:hypothetical protein